MATTYKVRGVRIETVEELARFSAAVFNSGIVPTQYKNKEGVMVAIQAGAELGIPPIASLQSFAVTGGKLSIWGDSMLGVCMASPDFDHDAFKEYMEKDKAVCVMARKGHAPITRTFSKDDAKAAGLLGKAGIWQNYQGRMLQMRARAYACRDLFPDILRGVNATEAQDEEEIVRMEAESEPVREKPALAAAMSEQVEEPKEKKKPKAKEPQEAEPVVTPTLAGDGEVIFGGDPDEPLHAGNITDEQVIKELEDFCKNAVARKKAVSVAEAAAKYLGGEIDGHRYQPGNGPSWFAQGDTEERKQRRMSAARTHLMMIEGLGLDDFLASFDQ